MARYSKLAQRFISKKMDKMKDEDMPNKQKIAVAMSYARKEGYKVPKKKE